MLKVSVLVLKTSLAKALKWNWRGGPHNRIRPKNGPITVRVLTERWFLQTPLSEAGSLSEGAAAFDVIAAGGPLSVDTGDLGECSSHFLCNPMYDPVMNEFHQNSLALCLRKALFLQCQRFGFVIILTSRCWRACQATLSIPDTYRWRWEYICTVNFVNFQSFIEFIYLGAWMAQWWEHSPPTNVARDKCSLTLISLWPVIDPCR